MTTLSSRSRHDATRASTPNPLRRLASTVAVALAVTLGGVGAATSATAAEEGDQVTFVGGSQVGSNSGTLFAFSDGSFGYCLDHDKQFVAVGGTFTAQPADAYRGTSQAWNIDPTVRGKVYWILAHSYPALSAADVGAVAGIETLTEPEAISAAQYAIWHFTNNLSLGALTGNAATLAAHYVENAVPIEANEPGDGAITITRDATYANVPGSNVMGPYVIHTDQVAVVALSVSDGAQVTDADGNPVTTARDGDLVYLRTETLGPVTLTATGTFVYLSGLIWVNGNAKVQEVAVLSPEQATRQAQIQDAAALQEPDATLTTTAIDKADGDKVLDASGGQIEDKIAYTGLVPGTAYTATGELMDRATGTSTGITATVDFVAPATEGTATVTFAVDGNWAGKDLVVFEVLTSNNVEIARHTDLSAASQTVRVADATPPQDPTPTPTTPTVSASASATAVAGPGTPGSARTLPRTGGDVLAVGLGSLFLLGTGATIVVARRRRTTR